MKQQDTGATIAIIVIGFLTFGLVIGLLILFRLVPPLARALSAMTIASRAPIGRALRRVTGRWPEDEAIHTQPTACLLSVILWSSLGFLFSGLQVINGAHPLFLLLGVVIGMLIGLLYGFAKEPIPQRPQRQNLEDVFPRDWEL